MIFLFYLLSVAVALSQYAPEIVDCPTGELLRKGDSLSDSEQEWLKKRNVITQDNLAKFLKYTAKLNESDYSEALEKNTIKIGLAFSGGGYRAMLSGAGQLAALDNTTTGSFDHGLGGLLESTTYLGGLSGGGWLVGSLVLNDWISIQEIIDSHKIWNIEDALYAPEGSNLIGDLKDWNGWISDIKDKRKAGYEISFVDLYSRGLSHFFLTTMKNTGAGKTWSSIADSEVFQNAQMPFPLMVSDAHFGSTDIIYNTSTVFETNPFEFGSWEESANGFVQIKYLGTNLTDGKPQDSHSCVNGFDNGGYMMGTTSAVFSIPLQEYGDEVENSEILSVLFGNLMKSVESSEFIHALYPNPYRGAGLGSNEGFNNNETLYLVDGGADKQAIPLSTVAAKSRDVDFVMAFDNDAQNNNFPSGSNIISTYNRQFTEVGKRFAFPPVPQMEEFQALKYYEKPVFFGCDAKNLTDLLYIPPLVAYVPNADYIYASNTSMYKLKYTVAERTGMISNGFETVTSANLTKDANWASCVGCAVIRRSQEREGIEQSEICKKCFQDYCYFS